MSDNQAPKIDNQPEEMSENDLDQVAGGAGAVGQHIEVLSYSFGASFNQAETLASSIQKKQDDTANGIIGKI